MDEEKKTTSGEEPVKQLTDKELEEILRQSDGKNDFPAVTFDEFTPPTYEEWVEACNVLLKGKPFDKIMFTKTYEGVTFNPMYTVRVCPEGNQAIGGPVATDGIVPTDDYPGMGDFLRGATVNGYKEAPWGIAQSCDETLPSDNNWLLKHEIDRGSTVYNVAIDSATQAGIDVKDAEEPGNCGVSITTLEDMKTLLDGLDLEKYPFMMYTGGSALRMLALVVAALKADGKDPAILHGTIGANPLAQLAKNGKVAGSLEKAYDDMASCISWTRKCAPKLRTIMARSDIFSRGGGNAVQEVAYTFAIAVEYIREMQKRDLEIHDIAQSITFGFNTGATFFIEIAKLRAARQVWANIMKAFGAEEADRSCKIHAKPAFFTKTVFDAGVNMLRNTTEIFSAVVGGVDTYENAPYDDTVRKGDEFSRRIARNVQIMLQEEFGMLRPIDPAGGSWGIEVLTKQMAEKIWAEFQKVEEMGGITKALQEGYPQAQILDILKQRFKTLDLRKDRAVGTNMYPNMAEELLEARPEDTAALKKQLAEGVERYRADIDEVHLKEALAKLAAGEDCVVCNTIEAFSAGATIGEVKAATTKEGENVEIAPISEHRWTERYERLRFDTEDYKKETGKNVEVFLCNMGKIPQHKARADFSTSFLQVGEFNVHLNDGFQDDEGEGGKSQYDKCVEAFKEGDYDVAVICSTDATYPDIVPALAPRIKEVMKEKGKGTLYLAGAPAKDMKQTYLDSGIDDFISVSANCYAVLRDLQQKKGMTIHEEEVK